MEWIAHLSDDGRTQSLKEHLENVANLAGCFASCFYSRDEAFRIGLLHDMGKYGMRSQRHMQDPLHTPKCDHSTAGAQYAFRVLKDIAAANAVAAHHAGLLDYGSPADDSSAGTFTARMQKRDIDPTDVYFTENHPQSGILFPEWFRSLDPYGKQFYIRMIFSCLVDADYLDTERFMQKDETNRTFDFSVSTMLNKLYAYVDPWLHEPSSSVNEKRSEILLRCFQGDQLSRGLYTLTVPTGGGKTVSSMAFALSHANRHHQKRVIFVVPYTSIIEQNAEVYRRIFGSAYVLEHHSGVEYYNNEKDEDTAQLALATENWDAPVIVTTSVQFFESLYAAKPSRCRKLHNLADSVIVFDEAQMIPLQYLRPCIKAITELVRHYGVTAVLCTATQPALNGIIEECAPGLPCPEIMRNTEQLFSFFKRTTLVQAGTLSEQVLSDQLNQESQVLCIVNSRAAAQRIFALLPENSRFHLSTLMTPNDRNAVLDKIRTRLKAGIPCHVVSTSLVECGVDVDFPSVWREEAGLDSILQAAGRCNREGNHAANESVVHIFSFETGNTSHFGAQIGAYHNTLRYNPSLDTPEAIKFYFTDLFSLKSPAFLDQKNILNTCCKSYFKKAAEDFQLIEQNTLTLYISNDANQADIALLRAGKYSQSLFRRLSVHSVSVYPETLNMLVQSGCAEKPEASFGILTNASLYSSSTGLSLSPGSSECFFV